jgi:hypothetical protein
MYTSFVPVDLFCPSRDRNRLGIRWTEGFLVYWGWVQEFKACAVSKGRLREAFAVLLDADRPHPLALEVYDMSDRENVFKRLRKLAASAAVGSGVEDAEARARWPLLFAFIAEPTYPDGTARELATVTVFVDTGVFKACLSDRDTQQSLWASSGSLEGLWDALEGRLNDPDADWRRKAAAPALKRGKKG